MNKPSYSDRTHYGELLLMIIAAAVFGILLTANLADSTHYQSIEQQETDAGHHIHRMSLEKLRKGN